MAHSKQHVWHCDYCGERVAVVEKPYVNYHQAGVGANCLPKEWGSISVTGLGESTVCPECLSDVTACIEQLRLA
jgi:DNA-directed RNA polymerase subunit RPC12/RpoP